MRGLRRCGDPSRKRSRRREDGSSSSRVNQDDLTDNERYFFRSIMARQRYNLQILSRKIVPARVFMETLDDFSVYMDGRGWLGMACYHWPINTNIVREFYANVELVDNNDEELSCYIRGKYFKITPTIISQALDIPLEHELPHPFQDDLANHYSDIASVLCDHDMFWNGRGVSLTQGNLSIVARLIHFFVATYVYPVIHVSNVTIDRALAMHTIMCGYPLDLPSVIFQQIRRFTIYPEGSLGFGFLITALVNMESVEILDTDIISAPLIISDSTISKSRGQRREVEPEIDLEGDTEELSDSPSPPRARHGDFTPIPPPPGDVPQNMYGMYNVFSTHASEVQRSLARLEANQARLEEEFRAMNMRGDTEELSD